MRFAKKPVSLAPRQLVCTNVVWLDLVVSEVPEGSDHGAFTTPLGRRFVKRRVTPGLGFGAFHTAQRTIQGYEAMHRLRTGQLEGVAKGDVLAQNRVINRLFGLAA